MMTETARITSTFQNNMHLLNSTTKISYITHHRKARYIIFPMDIQFYHVGERVYTFLHARRPFSSSLPQTLKINRKGKGSGRQTLSSLFDFCMESWI